MDEAIGIAKQNLEQAQARMKCAQDASRRDVDWEVGDKAYVNITQYDAQRPSRKLDNARAGPFEILEKKGHSYKLDLPASMKVHPVFSADKLRKDPADPLPGQEEDAPPEVNITGDIEWEVDEVLASRILRKKLQYRVKWLNMDEDLTWYPASDLKYAPDKLIAYHITNPSKPGPPEALLAWKKQYDDGIDDYDDLDNDKEMDQTTRTSFFGRGG